MISHQDPVLITARDGGNPAVTAAYAHHRDYPELVAEGPTPRDAALRLTERLTASLDHAPSEWRRRGIEHAIAEVRAFVERIH